MTYLDCVENKCPVWLFIGTRDPDKHHSLANNMFVATHKCLNTQPSAISAGHAGAAVEVRLPSGGREVKHTRSGAKATHRQDSEAIIK